MQIVQLKRLRLLEQRGVPAEPGNKTRMDRTSHAYRETRGYGYPEDTFSLVQRPDTRRNKRSGGIFSFCSCKRGSLRSALTLFPTSVLCLPLSTVVPIGSDDRLLSPNYAVAYNRTSHQTALSYDGAVEWKRVCCCAVLRQYSQAILAFVASTYTQYGFLRGIALLESFRTIDVVSLSHHLLRSPPCRNRTVQTLGRSTE